MLLSVLQLIGGAILALGYIPQIIQIIRTKSVSDLSLRSYLLMVVGISLMEAYAISLAISGVGLAFLITNTVSLCIVSIVVVLIMRYKSR
ncbi:MtN3 and saliva related transmembrane protein [Paenibacillus anaericanus]|uniref:PQ-loop domain-containing transporter n=1 Tax=Paenibacillus TaxID=44249 RepID=UPI0027845318|nr:PQ-loop domain-containing transporter [Paenibacillus anaericanus]MDQ0087219.1 MtN3 and saliva related transmembrane protein [Paenibacillus anaericanus]